jgi:hypothetical protein
VRENRRTPQYPLPSRQRLGHDARKQRCHISRQRFGHHARSTRCHPGNVSDRPQAAVATSRGNISDMTPQRPVPSRPRFGHHTRSSRCHIPRQRVGHDARSARCQSGNVWDISLWLLCLTRPHHVSRETRNYLERKGPRVNRCDSQNEALWNGDLCGATATAVYNPSGRQCAGDRFI